MVKATYRPWLFRYAVFLVCWTIVLLTAGALVTSEDAALAVPDWPLSYGSLTPPMVGGIAFEHSHRLLAAGLGILTIGLAFLLWRYDRRPFMKYLGLAALGGASILFYPTAIGWHPSEKQQHGAAQLDAWRTIQRSHAIANGIYVAAVNRVGYEGTAESGLQFWGNSFVCDPFGQVIAEAPTDREEILIMECDPRHMEDVRRNWPFLRDRRIDAYAPILQRWRD